MTTRMLLIKLSATLAAIICGGCIPNMMPPQPKAEPQTLRIEVVGEGKVNVGGDATITAKPAAGPTEPARECTCGCGKDGCVCSAAEVSAAPTANTSTKRSAPQVITQTQMVYQCRNGVCGWYPVSVPATGSTATTPKLYKLERGKVTLFVEPNGRAESAATIAARAALKESDLKVDVERTHSPPTGWWPTLSIIRTDGVPSHWTPGATGWHSGSLAEFQNWRTGQ